MDDIPLLLLAAGGSQRMGEPKQMLPWRNETLIEHQINTLLKINNTVCVVLGANSNLILPVIKKFKINSVLNKNWEYGMGSSIAAGVKRLEKDFPDSTGVLITLLDQPLVTETHLKKMLQSFKPSSQQIIVSESSEGWVGVPALFDKKYFEELKNLDGKEGAKTVIKKYNNTVTSIECGNILEDIDTPKSYQRILNRIISKS